MTIEKSWRPQGNISLVKVHKSKFHKDQRVAQDGWHVNPEKCLVQIIKDDRGYGVNILFN